MGSSHAGTDDPTRARRHGARHQLGGLSAADQPARPGPRAGDRVSQRRAAGDGHQPARAQRRRRGDADRARLGRVRLRRRGRKPAATGSSTAHLLAADQNAAAAGDQSPTGLAGRVRQDPVLSAPHSQFSMLTLGPRQPQFAAARALPTIERPERLWAGLPRSPAGARELLARPRRSIRQSDRSLDDWNTFYEGGIAAGRVSASTSATTA